MKKMLILLAVATIAAAAPGCCCPRLCPCCPWFNRGAACPPATTYAPLAATNPYNPCAPACSSWDPCQCAVVPHGQPGYLPGAPAYAPPYAPAFAQAPGGYMPGPPNYLPQAPVFAQGQPNMFQAQPTYYSEPSCGYSYMEPSCSAPSVVSYGPMMDCGPCGSCGSCDSCGGYDGGMVGGPVGPAPEAYVDPTPVAE